jgi:hypothetical protein
VSSSLLLSSVSCPAFDERVARNYLSMKGSIYFFLLLRKKKDVMLDKKLWLEHCNGRGWGVGELSNPELGSIRNIVHRRNDVLGWRKLLVFISLLFLFLFFSLDSFKQNELF